MHKSIVINLFGEPNAGKSTAGAYIFAKLKMLGISVELVTEYVKDKVWEENYTAIKYQPYILCNQMYRIHRVADKVDVVVVDSPIPLGLLYNDCGSKYFKDFAMEEFNNYNNVNYVIQNNTTDYTTVGRVTTQAESAKIKENMVELLQDYNVPYSVINNTVKDYDNVVENILTTLKLLNRLKLSRENKT